MPVDVLCIILSPLSIHDVLAGLRLVCKQLNFEENHDIWAKLSARRAPRRPTRFSPLSALNKPSDLSWRAWFVRAEYDAIVSRFLKLANSISRQGLVKANTIVKMHELTSSLQFYPIGRHDQLISSPTPKSRHRPRDPFASPPEDEMVEENIVGALLALAALSKTPSSPRPRLRDTNSMLVEIAANLIVRPRSQESRNKLHERFVAEISSAGARAFRRRDNLSRSLYSRRAALSGLSALCSFISLLLLSSSFYTVGFLFLVPPLGIGTRHDPSVSIVSSVVLGAILFCLWTSPVAAILSGVIVMAFVFSLYESPHVWAPIYISALVFRASALSFGAPAVIDVLSALLVSIAGQFVAGPLLTSVGLWAQTVSLSFVCRLAPLLKGRSFLRFYLRGCSLFGLAPRADHAWILGYVDTLDSSTAVSFVLDLHKHLDLLISDADPRFPRSRPDQPEQNRFVLQQILLPSLIFGVTSVVLFYAVTFFLGA